MTLTILPHLANREPFFLDDPLHNLSGKQGKPHLTVVQNPVSSPQSGAKNHSRENRLNCPRLNNWVLQVTLAESKRVPLAHFYANRHNHIDLG